MKRNNIKAFIFILLAIAFVVILIMFGAKIYDKISNSDTKLFAI